MKKIFFVGLALFFIFAAKAEAATISGSTIEIYQDLMQVNARIQGDASNMFLPVGGDTSGELGLILNFPETATNNSGPPVQGAYGIGALPLQATDVDNVVSGEGTSENPYTILSFASVTTDYYPAIDSLAKPRVIGEYEQLLITQIISHVNGTNEFRLVYVIDNTSDYERNLSAYIVARPSFSGTGSGSTEGVGLAGQTRELEMEIIPGYPFSSYQIGSPADIFSTIPNASANYNNSVTSGDVGIGFNWRGGETLPSGEQLVIGSTIRLSKTATPTQGQTAGAKPLGGTVLIKKPGGSFSELKEGDLIPVGSTIDTRKGRVMLTTAAGEKQQQAEFKEGIFVFQQKKNQALVNLNLKGSLSCSSKATISGLGPSARAAKRGRSLWGRGKGKYQTNGSKGSGSVRGTTWRVSDFCNKKTMIESISGQVLAREYKTGKQKLLKSGQKFFAK